MTTLGAYRRGMPYVGISFGRHRIEALMDTGFDGYVLLPGREVDSLGLRRIGSSKYRMSDGRTERADAYEAWIAWLGKKTRIEVDRGESDIRLAGMKLLRPLRVVMEPSRNFLMLSRG